MDHVDQGSVQMNVDSTREVILERVEVVDLRDTEKCNDSLMLKMLGKAPGQGHPASLHLLNQPWGQTVQDL